MTEKLFKMGEKSLCSQEMVLGYLLIPMEEGTQQPKSECYNLHNTSAATFY